MKVELPALLTTLAVLAGLPVGVYCYDASLRPDGRVVELTGVASTGTWTAGDVSGHNYWRTEFPSARVRVRTGETVTFRLRSADVTHSFSIPELGVGPHEVEAGKVRDVAVTFDRPGEFVFACYSVCGPRHRDMIGTIVVGDVSGLEFGKPVRPTLPEEGEHAAARGAINRLGCLACHTIERTGGTAGPELDRVFERLRPSWYREFLSDSARPHVRGGDARMPDMVLDPADVETLAAYFAKLGEWPDYEIEEPAPTPETIAEGRELFARYQCSGCHRLDGAPFAKADFYPENEMNEIRRLAPDLVHARRRLDPDWAVDFILSPERFLKDTKMPRLVLRRAEAEAIRDFLWGAGDGHEE